MMTSGWQRMSVLGTILLGIAPVFAQVGENDESRRPFSIYATESARGLAERAEEHRRAGRFSDAIVDLQALLEEHHGEVLAKTRPIHKGRRSEGDVHRGAADHARRQMLELPEEARAIYRDRYENRASLALKEARAAGDRRELTQVARRWPLTHSARQAWWAIGDLELEIGNRQEALHAWERAVAWTLLDMDLTLVDSDAWRTARTSLEASGQATAGALARATLAATIHDKASLASKDLRDQVSSSLGSAMGPALTRGSSEGIAPPGRSADGWRNSFRVPDDHPFDHPDGRYSMFLARGEDALFVTTTLELFCINAYTGKLSWRSGEPAGWDQVDPRDRVDFFDAVDRTDSLIAPAIGQGIAVAALQIPHRFEPKIDYGEMNIIKQLPNRRLFAFDTRTGEELWNTTPPPLWDGESGDFSDRMRIVGSPVISGSRVLVPTARMRGRIEYHIGCFDLFTGELLWSTALITGQRERNMFGRAVYEFSAPPLVVADGQVIALTQLGTVAALNLFTGDLIWEVIYEKLPLRKAQNFSAPKRKRYWKNAPPVVVGDTVIATPDDSKFVIAIDRKSGTLIWSYRNDALRLLGFGDSQFNVLLGADQNSVYLGGKQVIAIDFPLGIDTGEQTPWRRWVWPATRGNNLPSRSPRAVLSADRVWIPDGDTLMGIDRQSGRETESLSMKSGNLLVGEGLLYSLRSDSLSGKFEWTRLLQSARDRCIAAPEDLNEALALAQLLEERGRTVAANGSYQESSQHLAEARAVI
ncbi:MAG: PQQ-binding-like beta-propeller repeat protein, partial [Gammaproteobacteria bacterium]|nr:PQQ-binding-like beta-propeller repeat protein [Gammaproteobacteria bacterium]